MSRDASIKNWLSRNAVFARLVMLSAVFLLMMLAALPAAAYAAEEAGYISQIEGRVDILHTGASSAVPALLNDTIFLGDVIRTKTGGRVEIHFKDETTLRLAAGSRLKIDKYVFNPDKTRQTATVTLFRGKLRAAVSKASTVLPVSTNSATFTVNTPTAVAGVTGTVLFVSYDKGVAGVVFKEGHGFVFNANAPGNVVAVSAGQITFVTGGDAPPLEPRPATETELNQYVKDTTVGSGTSGGSSGSTSDGSSSGAYGYSGTDIGTGGTPGGGTTDTGAGTPAPIITLYPDCCLTPETLPAPLTVYISGLPASITNISSANLVVTSNYLATYTYILDGVGVTTASPSLSDILSLSELPEAVHTLTVTAQDADGNISAPFVYTWTTDYTPPVAAIVVTPPALTNSSTPSFGFTANEPAAYYSYSLDGGATWVSTGPSLILSAVGEGGNAIQVKSTDLAGNTSVGFSSYSWTADYTAPAALTFTGTPAAITNVNSATIGATATDLTTVTYTYTLDGATSDGILTGLTEGAHTFVAIATDGAGNTANITYNWTTDYTPPAALALSGTPTVVNNVNSANVNATATDVNAITYGYTLDGATVPDGNIASLIEGPHTLTVIATDAAGNSSAPVSYQWFYGARQYDMFGSAVDTTGVSVLSVASTGNLNLISTGTQGAWLLNHTGTYTGARSNSVTAGGTATDSLGAFNGYWLDKLSLTCYFSGCGGASNLSYLSATAYGTGAGTVAGGYYDWTNVFSATDTGLGTYTETPLDFSGNVWGGLLWYDPSFYGGVLRYAHADPYDKSRNVDGIIGLVGDLWTNGTADAHLMGTYTTSSGAEPYLIYGSGWYMDYNPTMSGYSTALGGAFNGYNVGVWNAGVTRSNAVAIYIDPSGMAGYMRGGLDGAYYSGLGLWEMNGTVSTTSVETTTIAPVDLVANLVTGHYGQYGSRMSGDFQNGKLISSTYMEGSLKGLSGHNWGIWNGGMAGTYDTTNTYSYFQDVVGSTDFYYNGRWGYMLGSLNSADDWGYAGNTFTGDLSTRFMTSTLLGTMTSDGVYGQFDPATGYWQSSMVGTWQATPLTHVSDISASTYYLGDPYGYEYIYSVYDGSISAYLGGTDSLWAPTSTLGTFMGSYSPSSTAPHIWGQEFNSHNYLNGTDTTYDTTPGAYYGYVTGTETGGAMETLLYAMYVDPSGNVGYLKGGLNGTYSPSIGVFEQTGNIDKFEMAQNTGISAADFQNSIYWGGGGEGSLSGPSLSGYDNGLYTMTLVDRQTLIPQNWGLYYHEFQGQSAGPAGVWTAKAGGSDGIGVVNPSAMNSGQYSYADGGTYYYRYDNANTEGYQYYPRSLTGENYQTIYYADGTTWTDNFTGIGGPSAGAGTWNTAAGLSFLATPPDSLNATVDYTNSYISGTDDYAYWLMDVNGTAWSGDKLAATTGGSFLGHYYRGTLTGDLAGVYDPVSGAWAANGVGIYESTPLAFGGYNNFSYYYYDGWSVYDPDWDYGYANFGATVSPFADPAINGVGGTSVDLYLMGRNYRSNGLVTWWSAIEGNNYVDTTSHWYGWNAGITRFDNSMAGMMNALYIDKNGNAGILTGDYIGATYPDLSMFEAQGLLTADQKVAAGVYDPASFWSYVASANPNGYIDGRFSGDTGYISSDDYLQNIYSYETATKWFVNPNTGIAEPWGIYKLELGGTYDNPSGANTFTMDVGGDYWKGNSDDYWIAQINGNWNTDQTIDGTVTGRYLTPYALGDITGKMLGSYDTYNTGAWEGVALGGFTETPLAFSGVIDYAYDWPVGPYYGLYGDNGGYFDTKGDVYGLLGGVTSPWSGAPDVVYMGTYNDTSLSQYIWNDDIYSYDAKNVTYTTMDGGAFHGFIGGVFNNKTINARVISLYVDPDGNAGYIKGSLTGKLYPGLSNYSAMFEADGKWQATQMATAADIGYIAPSALYNTYYNSGAAITDANMTATVSGTFGAGNGRIDGVQFDEYYGSYYGWTRYIDGQNWGIYDLIINGYGNNGFSNPNNDATWSAKIRGTAGFGSYFNGEGYNSDYGYYIADITGGTWANMELAGSLSGIFMTRTKMGTITGDLLGYYDPSIYGSYDEWAATSLGVWEEAPLAHSGQVSPDNANWGNDLYSYDPPPYAGWLDTAGSSTGLMGGAVAPWSGATDALYVGTYSALTPAAYLWAPEINSYNVNDSTNTTIDGGMYKGFIGGVWNADTTIDANVYALYIDPAGNAGVLKGGVTGAYYPSLSNMFAVDGQWTPTVLTTGLDAATDTVDVVTYDYGLDITASSRSNVSRVYVANSGNDMVSVIDATTDIVASTLPTGFYPYGVVVNPRTGLVYVANQNSGSLSVFDANNANVANIAVGTAPKGVTVNPQANMAYVANSGDGTVSVIDTVSNTVVATISVGLDPREVAVNPLTNTAYVTNWTDNTVSVINTVDNTVTTTISIGLGISPKAVAVNPQTNTAYVANWNSDTVSVIDTLTNTVLTTITVGVSPNDIAVNPQTNRAYVANFNANTVSVIDTLTNTVVAIIPVGLAPREVAVDTQTNKVYVTDYSSGTLSVIDTTTDTVITDIGMGSGPEGVDAHTYDITVPYGTFNNGSGTITVAGNEMLSATDWRYSIAGQDWGIWKSIIGGDYTGTPTDIWSLDTLVDLSAQGTIYGTHTDGTQWSNGVLKGQTYGYGADVTTTPKTWISVGDIFGTIDSGASTWQAIQTSAFIETSKFLAMRQTVEGQLALTQLNIPFVEVGRTDLTGTDGNLSVSMNNVVFLAPTSNAAPRLWATDGVGNGVGGVTGTYVTDPNVNTTVGLSGSNINADFTVKNWTGGTWMATVNGGGTPSGAGAMDGTAITMSGAGAGTYGAGSLDGTASGVAH